MEGLRKGSLFPFLETGRGEWFPAPLHPAEPGRKALCRYPAPVFFCRSRPFGEVTHPFPGCGPTGRTPSFCRFCLLPGSRWAICPCAPPAAPCRKVRWSRGHASHAAPETAVAPAVEQPCFLPLVRRSGARSFAYRPGCPGGTGTGMTRERPGKSEFSGREQKKHCLLLRLGIWTFDCVREVAAWGR